MSLAWPVSLLISHEPEPTPVRKHGLPSPCFWPLPETYLPADSLARKLTLPLMLTAVPREQFIGHRNRFPKQFHLSSCPAQKPRLATEADRGGAPSVCRFLLAVASVPASSRLATVRLHLSHPFGRENIQLVLRRC